MASRAIRHIAQRHRTFVHAAAAIKPHFTHAPPPPYHPADVTQFRELLTRIGPLVHLSRPEIGSSLYLTGVAHDDPSSIDFVSNVLTELQPDVTAIEMCDGHDCWPGEVRAALQHPCRGMIEPIDEPMDVKTHKAISFPTEWLVASLLNENICNRFATRFKFHHPMDTRNPMDTRPLEKHGYVHADSYVVHHRDVVMARSLARLLAKPHCRTVGVVGAAHVSGLVDLLISGATEFELPATTTWTLSDAELARNRAIWSGLDNPLSHMLVKPFCPRTFFFFLQVRMVIVQQPSRVMSLLALTLQSQGGTLPMARELLAACDRGESGWTSAWSLFARALCNEFGLARTADAAASGWPGAAAASWCSLELCSDALHSLAEPTIDALVRAEMRRREQRAAALSEACARGGVELEYDLSSPIDGEDVIRRDPRWRVLAWQRWL